MMTATAALLDQSTVESFNQKEGISLFTGLIAQAATGKTLATQYVINALHQVEDIYEIDQSNSKVVGAQSTEDLVNCFNRSPVLIGKH